MTRAVGSDRTDRGPTDRPAEAGSRDSIDESAGPAWASRADQPARDDARGLGWTGGGRVRRHRGEPERAVLCRRLGPPPRRSPELPDRTASRSDCLPVRLPADPTEATQRVLRLASTPWASLRPRGRGRVRTADRPGVGLVTSEKTPCCRSAHGIHCYTTCFDTPKIADKITRDHCITADPQFSG
jgi:hypothetical protein